MKTIVVWVLVAFVGGHQKGGPLVVDNIDSQRNCRALAEQIIRAELSGYTPRAKCFAVRKVVSQ